MESRRKKLSWKNRTSVRISRCFRNTRPLLYRPLPNENATPTRKYLPRLVLGSLKYRSHSWFFKSSIHRIPVSCTFFRIFHALREPEDLVTWKQRKRGFWRRGIRWSYPRSEKNIHEGCLRSAEKVFPECGTFSAISENCYGKELEDWTQGERREDTPVTTVLWASVKKRWQAVDRTNLIPPELQ